MKGMQGWERKRWGASWCALQHTATRCTTPHHISPHCTELRECVAVCVAIGVAVCVAVRFSAVQCGVVCCVMRDLTERVGESAGSERDKVKVREAREIK